MDGFYCNDVMRKSKELAARSLGVQRADVNYLFTSPATSRIISVCSLSLYLCIRFRVSAV